MNLENKNNMSAEEIERIINILIKNDHMSMFEFQGFTISVTMPIFTQRQWMRHRHFSFHEVSRRYSKICIGDIQILEQYYKSLDIYDILYKQIEKYNILIDDYNLTKEKQRGIIGTQFPTTVLISGNLREWIHFLKLRMCETQQQEIREYQIYIFYIFIKEKFPLIYKILLRRITTQDMFEIFKSIDNN